MFWKLQRQELDTCRVSLRKAVMTHGEHSCWNDDEANHLVSWASMKTSVVKEH